MLDPMRLVENQQHRQSTGLRQSANSCSGGTAQVPSSQRVAVRLSLFTIREFYAHLCSVRRSFGAPQCSEQKCAEKSLDYYTRLPTQWGSAGEEGERSESGHVRILAGCVTDEFGDSLLDAAAMGTAYLLDRPEPRGGAGHHRLPRRC